MTLMATTMFVIIIIVICEDILAAKDLHNQLPRNNLIRADRTCSLHNHVSVFLIHLFYSFAATEVVGVTLTGMMIFHLVY